MVWWGVFRWGVLCGKEGMEVGVKRGEGYWGGSWRRLETGWMGMLEGMGGGVWGSREKRGGRL